MVPALFIVGWEVYSNEKHSRSWRTSAEHIYYGGVQTRLRKHLDSSTQPLRMLKGDRGDIVRKAHIMLTKPLFEGKILLLQVTVPMLKRPPEKQGKNFQFFFFYGKQRGSGFLQVAMVLALPKKLSKLASLPSPKLANCSYWVQNTVGFQERFLHDKVKLF